MESLFSTLFTSTADVTGTAGMLCIVILWARTSSLSEKVKSLCSRIFRLEDREMGRNKDSSKD